MYKSFPFFNVKELEESLFDEDFRAYCREVIIDKNDQFERTLENLEKLGGVFCMFIS